MLSVSCVNNTKDGQATWCGTLLSIGIYAVISGFLIAVIFASVKADENSSLIFRILKPIIETCWEAIYKLVSDKTFYVTFISIVVPILIILTAYGVYLCYIGDPVTVANLTHEISNQLAGFRNRTTEPLKSTCNIKNCCIFVDPSSLEDEKTETTSGGKNAKDTLSTQKTEQYVINSPKIELKSKSITKTDPFEKIVVKPPAFKKPRWDSQDRREEAPFLNSPEREYYHKPPNYMLPTNNFVHNQIYYGRSAGSLLLGVFTKN